MLQWCSPTCSRRSLMLTTLLSSSALLALPLVAQAQTIGCSLSGSTCTFSNGETSAAPFAENNTGADGSGSTNGSAGPSYTYVAASSSDVTLGDESNNPGGSANAVFVRTAGGRGSKSGPSTAGAGGSTVYDAAPSATYTVAADAFSGENPIATVSLNSLGGDGEDDNTNKASNGGAGGAGGAVTYDNATAAVSLGTNLSGTTADNSLTALDVRSEGGTGGRGSESLSFHPVGGAGGAGGNVTVVSGQVEAGTSSAPLTGAGVFGIRARSLGGRGPNNVNSSNGKTQGGGGASTGGSGGTVSVTTKGQVNVNGQTTSASARAVNAQSYGGDGGWAYDVDITTGFTDGGNGGQGGSVSVTVNDVMELVQNGTSVSAEQSALVYAISQGGEGGVGQSGTTGGAGGTAGGVTVDVTADAFASEGPALLAAGTAVDAIVAMSAGGLGGAGLNDADNSTGGIGGNGGEVSVTVDINDGQIIEARASSEGNDGGRAIVAQSIGNFGGPGSDGDAIFGEPGSAGAGGNGDAVTVNMNSGTLTTDGTLSAASGLNFAHGVLAQSIGGGGGDGGDFQGLFGGKGGAGGKGGDGAAVMVTNAGTIEAQGIHANGILAQSIGGGGGTGGVADGAIVALGGSGGSGGSSGAVDISNTGTVTTNGYGGIGILAQSIVGAGGAAGVADALVSLGGVAGSDSGVPAGTTTVANTGSVTTSGAAAAAIVAQSIGGGGGSATGAANSSNGTSYGVFTLGTDGGAGGAGGNVDVTDIGTLSTDGRYAHGLIAQSVGGGGGNGGDAFAGDILISASSAIGGLSGGGGDGGDVTVSNAAAVDISTGGAASAGILAQSVGGGGGSGGDATTDTVLAIASLSMGGLASAAGSGGSVGVNLDNAAIATKANRSAGVVAQSIGGGGGNGGSGTSNSAGVFSIGISAGGIAGAGGDGGDVTVSATDTTISTAQDVGTLRANDAIGILAQSVGGGGGTGGAAAASAITFGIPFDPEDPDMTISASAQFAMGGRGGEGGDGSMASASVSNGSSLTTNGAGSHGILVQSIGGGGGSGGDASTATTTIPDSTQQYSLTISGALGGTGGDGGFGGAASATVGSTTPASTRTTVSTTGNYANAVVVQSVGGGGGNSGLPSSSTDVIRGEANVSITFDVGAANLTASESGVSGGTADATLGADATLLTMGAGSRGIVAQSIGGGGGTVQGGEIALGGKVSGDNGTSYKGSATVNLGQQGGQGGNGGAVSVTTTSGSTITTSGIDADGIIAQSIGGGGGLAGSVGSSSAAPSRTAQVSDNIDVTLTASVGGAGGTGGDSAGVDLNIGTVIVTDADYADGVVAQSIGGGGGTGGTALTSGTGESAQIDIGVGGTGGTGGDGGAVTAFLNGDSPAANVTTSGFMAHGIVLQSIGGGGGQGAAGSAVVTGQISVGGGFGGSGGASGAGGTVTITEGSYADIATNGPDSHGIVAQSIGGGGGLGGAGTTASSDGSYASGDVNFAVDVAVGGQGGTSGAGGKVALDLGADIATHGARSFGILAQSIGGGGGQGGAGAAANMLSVSLGGSSGVSGNGDAVSVSLQGEISTAGAGAHGIVAQSIGGGGGIAGDVASGLLTTTSQSGGGSGNGGTVMVTTDATITTGGDYAAGIFAQSIGGGGGIAGGLTGDATAVSAGANSGGTGTGGGVTIVANDDISATGSLATGIFAQSAGPSGAGTVAVTVGAKVTGGTDDGGVGVFIADGHDNTLTVNAAGAVVASSGGAAVLYETEGTVADGSTLVINNSGTISGSVTGETGAITLNNLPGGTASDAALYEADVVNSGRLVVGGPASSSSTAQAKTSGGAHGSLTTRITGDFTQTAGGATVAEADFSAQRGATLNVDGDANVSGNLEVAARTLAPNVALTVLEAKGTLTGAFTAVDTPAVDYQVARNGKQLNLTVASTRFENAFAAISANERQVGAHLDDVFRSGAGAYGALLAGISDLSAGTNGEAAYGRALASLSLGGSQAAAAAQSAQAQSRLDKAMSCPVFSPETGTMAEESCFWGEVGGASVDQSGRPGYDGTVWGMVGGIQVEVRPDWFVGVAAGYEDATYDSSDGLSNADSETFYASGVVKRQFGNALLSGGFTGSYGTSDTERTIAVPGFTGTARGSSDVTTLAARVRAAYTLAHESTYLRPFVDFDVIYTHAGGYTETGAGIYNLKVNSQSETAFVATPAVEVGTQMQLDGGWSLDGFASAGLSLSTEDNWRTTASLVSAPAGSGAFATTLPVADVVGRVGVGVKLTSSNGFDATMEYGGAFGDDYASHNGFLRLSKRF